ncbi:cyclopropane-fatty-acyl-phospholipid synthase [Yersinia frederiksenii]|nr:cyclopropane-fatty-acyl-phospholipid synthase [Yersinia frederiksenii]
MPWNLVNKMKRQFKEKTVLSAFPEIREWISNKIENGNRVVTDRIVSVGMFEHVGPKNYRTYFEVVSRNLKPDGLFLLHTIGSNQTDLNVDPWINKYIFPNGCLPSVTHIASTSEDLFVLEDWHNFGCDYDRTLMAWFDAFQQNWPQIKENYNDRFYRMFTYYLNACAGAFRARNIQLWQVLLSPKGVDGGIRVYR